MRLIPASRPARARRASRQAPGLFVLVVFLTSAALTGCTPGLPGAGPAFTPSATHPEKSPFPATAAEGSWPAAPTRRPDVSPTPSPSLTPATTTRVNSIIKPTPSPTPPAPVVGGADKIAFLSAGEVWAADLDGTDLVRLTADGSAKAHLQWAPGEQAVLYASGGCLYSAGLATLQTRAVACFDPPAAITAFALSPDGRQAAIGLDRELFLVPYDPAALSTARDRAGLIALAACPYHAPLVFKGWPVAARQVSWSQDGERLAVLRQAAEGERLVDEVHLFDLAGCATSARPLDEFPATRFRMPDYAIRPILESFGWEGNSLFALTGYRSNAGYGELWLYDSGQQQAIAAQPIPGGCCYRDATFSPDGRYLLFVYQDHSRAPRPPAQIYLVPVRSIGSGLVYPPLPLPEELFDDPKDQPKPVLRPLP